MVLVLRSELTTPFAVKVNAAHAHADAPLGCCRRGSSLRLRCPPWTVRRAARPRSPLSRAATTPHLAAHSSAPVVAQSRVPCGLRLYARQSIAPADPSADCASRVHAHKYTRLFEARPGSSRPRTQRLDAHSPRAAGERSGSSVPPSVSHFPRLRASKSSGVGGTRRQQQGRPPA